MTKRKKNSPAKFFPPKKMMLNSFSWLLLPKCVFCCFHFFFNFKVKVKVNNSISKDIERGKVFINFSSSRLCCIWITCFTFVCCQYWKFKLTPILIEILYYRSDALLEGDFIVSVNGIKTRDMKHDEVINLLKNTGDQVLLEVEYQLPDTGNNSSISPTWNR